MTTSALDLAARMASASPVRLDQLEARRVALEERSRIMVEVLAREVPFPRVANREPLRPRYRDLVEGARRPAAIAVARITAARWVTDGHRAEVDFTADDIAHLLDS